MKLVKRLLLILLLFVVIVVIISVFLPSTFQLERKIIVNADKEQVFKQINNLKNWKNWSPWAIKDSSIYLQESNYSNPSEGKGATFVWNSSDNEVGDGKMTITESQPYKLIEYTVDFGMGDVMSGFYINEQEEGVEVNWKYQMDFGFNPISKFYGLFMEDYVAADYEMGLKRLKSYSENLPKINSVKVEKMAINQQWFLSIRDTVNPSEMNNIHGKLFQQISKFMNENGIEIFDSPIVIYHLWSDSIIDIEAGIPVKDSVQINDNNIHLNHIQPGNVVTAIHYGSYDRLPETYFGINEWMRKNKVVVNGPLWEKYITDPTSESNPEKWQTAIFFPIQ